MTYTLASESLHLDSHPVIKPFLERLDVREKDLLEKPDPRIKTPLDARQKFHRIRKRTGKLKRLHLDRTEASCAGGRRRPWPGWRWWCYAIDPLNTGMP